RSKRDWSSDVCSSDLMGRQVVVAGACQVGLTVAATGAAAAAGTTRWQVALFLGFLAALSSTAIVLKLLTEKGDIDTPHGRLATEIGRASCRGERRKDA